MTELSDYGTGLPDPGKAKEAESESARSGSGPRFRAVPQSFLSWEDVMRVLGS
jgi:hypothetical protein